MADSEVMVRMGELAVAAKGGATLVSIGLGSCIGLALIDRAKGIAGLAHVMLPAAPADGAGETPGKFADHAVPALLQELAPLGSRPGRLADGGQRRAGRQGRKSRREGAPKRTSCRHGGNLSVVCGGCGSTFGACAPTQAASVARHERAGRRILATSG